MSYYEDYQNRSASEPVGEYIRNLRHANGWSLQELSNRCNGLLSKSRISNYEQGIRHPKVDAATILADAFDVTPSQILRIED